MTDPRTPTSAFRDGLIEGLAIARETERAILAAFEAAERDAHAPDGGWSAKDIQAHLSAWRHHQVRRMRAIRENRPEPASAPETDEINAVIHAERAGWPWEHVVEDADATAADLIAEVEAASDETLGLDRISGSIMGNGSEHTLTHVGPLAAHAGQESRVLELADAMITILDRGGWPSRPAAYARYNLACYHALAGNLDVARSLLRRALPEREELRTFAPEDDDLIALRLEIPMLAEG